MLIRRAREVLQIPREKGLPGMAALAALRLERSVLVSANGALLAAVGQEARLPFREAMLKKTAHGARLAPAPVRRAAKTPMACALVSPPLRFSPAMEIGL